MAILTGGAKDAMVSDDVFDKFLIFPDLTQVDEQIFLRDVIKENDPKTALGILLVMLDYHKVDISFILGVSTTRFYKELMPSMQKAYEQAKRQTICPPED